MRQPVSFWCSAYGVFTSLLSQRYLVWQLTKRDVAARYRGSMLGIMWSVFQPLMMLAVYSFVFGVVFRARWPELTEAGAGQSRFQFAVVLFSGLVFHGFLSECLHRAPRLVLQNANYVKKLVFPLEILPWSVVGKALVQLGISLLILLAFCTVTFHSVQWTIVYLPFVLAPFVVLAAGLVWGIAALGVFVRDIDQVIGVLVIALLFLSPIFFPISAVPEILRPFIYLNPLTFVVDQARDVLLWGRYPDWTGLAAYTGVALVIAWFGFYVFARLRRAFADVL
jgi:lipopolysaccharide transport system permease protein